MIQKQLQPSIDLMDKINNSTHDFNIKVSRTKNHPFNERDLTFVRKNNAYTFHTTTKIRKGIQKNNELDVKRETEIKLFSNSFSLYSTGKHLILNRISYPDIDDVPLLKKAEGYFTSITTRKNSFYKKERFYRIMLPLNKQVRLFGDFTGWNYSVDGKRMFEPLIKLTISGNEYHFYTHTNKAKENFFIIDATSKLQVKEFLKIINSILLSYAFLKGDYHGRQAYIFSYSYQNLNIPSSLSTMIMGGEVYGGFSVHSTKPLSLVKLQDKIKYKKDAEGKIIGTDTRWMNKYHVEFPSECFAKLCELIYTKEGILRAVILFVNNHKASLELKVPTLFVAIENITKVLIKKDDTPALIIEDGIIAEKIQKVIKNTVKEINLIKRTHQPKELNVDEEKAYKANFSRIENKLYGFNKGSNNQKLSDPFSELGYTLTAEERDLLVKDRNKFLHGDDYSTDNDYDNEFRELFHISMRLQKLIAVLLLKKSGYSGYILNNTKIYDYISEKTIKEDVFVKI